MSVVRGLESKGEKFSEARGVFPTNLCVGFNPRISN